MPQQRHRGGRVLRRLAWLTMEYAVLCAVAGVALGHISLRMPRRVLSEQAEVRDRWARDFGARLEDVTLRAADGVTLRGWYAAPAAANGRHRSRQPSSMGAS